MPFRKMLQELVDSVAGATGAILADWEGEAVVQYSLFDEFEIKLVGAHSVIILAKLCEMHSGLKIGDPEDLVITSRNGHLIVAAVGPEYVLAMMLERRALPASALSEVRKVVSRFEEEIY